MKKELNSQWFAIMTGIFTILFPIAVIGNIYDNLASYDRQSTLNFSCDANNNKKVLAYGTSHVTNARTYLESEGFNLLNIHSATTDLLDDVIEQSCEVSSDLILIRFLNSIELYEPSASVTIGLVIYPFEQYFSRSVYDSFLYFDRVILSHSYLRTKELIKRFAFPKRILNPDERFQLHSRVINFQKLDDKFPQSMRTHINHGRCMILVESPVSESYRDYLLKKRVTIDIIQYLSDHQINDSEYYYIGLTDFDYSNPQFYVDADHLNKKGWGKYWISVAPQIKAAIAKCQHQESAFK